MRPAPLTVAALILALGTLSSAPPAAAFTDPVYGEVSVYAYGGDLVSHDFSSTDSDTGGGALSAQAGAQWWCDFPGCSLTFGPGAASAWGTVTADPRTGLIRTRAGAWNSSQDAVSWEISVPWLPGGTIVYSPGYWGEAVNDIYLRSAWKIVATDAGLAPGDPVDLSAALDVTATLETGDITTLSSAILLNTAEVAGANWLNGTDSITFHTFGELVAPMPDVGWVSYIATEPGVVDHHDSLVRTFAVGDVVFLESVMRVVAAIPNEGIPKEVWVRADDTMQASVLALTPGITLVPVPEPGTWATMAAGLVLLAGAAMRRRAR